MQIAGAQFWKQPARKFYAVTEGDLASCTRKRSSKQRRSVINIDDDDDDDTYDDFVTGPPTKKRTLNAERSSIGSRLNTIEAKVDALHADVDKVLSLTAETKVPLGLKLLLQEAFLCPICNLIMTPPVIFAKCCRSIIGCESCVNFRYSGENATTKHCPQCRAERGYAGTLRQCGLDDFLTGIKDMVSSD